MADQLAQDRNMVPDSRAEFEAWWREHCLKTFPKDYDISRLERWGSDYKADAHDAWQAANQRQQERIAALEAQVQALSLDAGRYRWLRSGEKTRQGLTIIGKGGTRLISRDGLRALLSFDFWCTTEELDSAIDAAIAAGKGEAS